MKGKVTLGLLVLCMLFLCVTVTAWGGDSGFQQQPVTVNGTVVDQPGQPLIGVQVFQLGSTNNGTTTRVDGTFTLTVPQGARLSFSYIGYQPQEVVASPGMRVTMAEDIQQVSEIVVTALGIRKEKKALGYSVQDIKSDELLRNKNTNIVNSLSSKIAGLNVTQTSGAAGAGANIVLRGGTSLERDNQPLFVVDGIIYDNSSPIGGNSGFDGLLATSTTQSNRVMDINPEDVESTSVLKGPVAAALYGSRAAAGAIVITTKRGQEGAVRVEVGSKFSASWINRFPEQQSTYKQGAYAANGNVNTLKERRSWGTIFGPNESMYDNLEDFFRSGHAWDNTVSVSGGSKNGSFYLSASRYDQTGIVPTTSYDKSTFRFNGEHKFGKLTAGANVAYSSAHTKKTFTSGGLFDSGNLGAMQGVYSWARSQDMAHYMNEDGTQYRQFADQGVELKDDIDNPYWVINKDRLSDATDRLTGSINLNFEATDWFNIIYRAGIDRYVKYDKTFIAPGSAVPVLQQKGRLSDQDRIYQYLSSNLMLNFHKTVGDWDLSLMLGHAAEDTKVRTERRTASNFVIPGFFSFANVAASDKQFAQAHSRKRLVGVFGEARVGWRNMVYLSVTGRNDWTSTLPLDNRSYFYPSVSGSFVFSELIRKNDIFSFGKIRLSYAKVGKDTSPYATATTLWEARNYILGVGYANTWQRGNPYLRPEISESYEIGAELRFFNGRFNIDFTYYNTRSYDNIITPRLSQTTGYILLSTNAGTVYNKGMELSISGTPVRTRNFRWETTLNLAHNRGTVGTLLEGTNVLYVTDVQVGTAKAASFEHGDFMGMSGTEWYRYTGDNAEWKGLPILSAKETGSDGNTYSMPDWDNNASGHQIGNREPKLTGGWNNTLTYKNWTLGVLFDFRIGGDIYNGTDYYMTINGMSKRSESREQLTIHGLVPEGDGYREVDQRITDPYVIQRYYSHYLSGDAATYVTNTNWLRLRALTLSYSAPKAWLARSGFIKGITFTLTGTNLWLWTNYKGMDPEVSAAGSGIIGSSSVGIDYCGVPSTRGMTFGINLTF